MITDGTSHYVLKFNFKNKNVLAFHSTFVGFFEALPSFELCRIHLEQLHKKRVLKDKTPKFANFKRATYLIGAHKRI